tara:strand:- start:8896 stop:10413 length:1518 start_codon:yes stop_codon:yes gene_type:complete
MVQVPPWINTFISDTKAKGVWKHWEKVVLVDNLGYFLHCRPSLGEQARAAVQQVLGVKRDRFEKMLLLETREEISRALYWHPTTGHHRLKGEEHYPRTGWLGKYLLWSQDSEAPLGWHFWCGVAAIGAASRRNFWYNFRAYVFHLNHSLLLIGPSGQGKNVVINHHMDLLRRANKVLEKKGIAEDLQIQLFPQMGTPEKFIQKMATKPVTNLDPTTAYLNNGIRWTEAVCVLANEEISTLLGKESHKGGGQWVKIITAISGGDDWHNTTICRGDEVLRKPALTFIGGSTADWLKFSVTEELFSGGFMSRCIVLPRDDVRRKASYPGANDPVMANELSQYLVELAMHKPREIEATPEADELFQAWYDGTARDVGGSSALIGWESRRKIHIWRLACVLALSEQRFTVEARDFRKALECIEYEERYLPDILAELSETKESETVNRVLTYLQKQGQWVNRTDLSKACGRWVPYSKQMEVVLGTLLERKQIERKIKRQGKKDTQFYRAAV